LLLRRSSSIVEVVVSLHPQPALASPSHALETLLQQRLTSVDQIEIVLLLMRDPSRAWTAPEVAAALRTPPESAAMRLFLLASTGLITFEAAGMPKYRYAGGDAAPEAVLSELARLYESDRAVVAALVGAPPDPLRSFADAFKLKK
jgi:hypothetical protein